MTEAAAAAGLTQMTRVQRVRVQIRADHCVYEGYVHLLGETCRLMEVLNDPKPFLNITEVIIQDRNDASTVHSPYVSLNKGAITHVIVLAGDRPTEAVEAPDSSRPAAALSEPTTALPATPPPPPMVPPAGPRTMPAPPPKPIAGRGFDKEPPTQPFPRSAGKRADDDDVSDLILDDDSDDIDPDDLERDVGALITGSAEGA
jgi:hypothetical protein